jgi:hypothetical protein
MSRVHVFKVGPLDAGGASLYVPSSPDVALELVEATSDLEGLRRIAAQRSGLDLVCSPDLAAAGAQLGIRAAPLGVIQQMMRIQIALGGALDRDAPAFHDLRVLSTLLTGVADLVDSGVATRQPTLPFAGHMEGDRDGRIAGLVSSAPPGLVLLTEPAAVDAVAGQPAARWPALLPTLDHLAVTIEPAPAFLAVWLTEFYDNDRMPRLIKRRAGDKVAPDAEDALVISGVLSALSRIVEAPTTAHAEIETPGRVVRTYVSPLPVAPP